MIRINGIGTTLLDVSEKDSKGRIEATIWFSFLYLPILPLKRIKARLIFNENGEILVETIQNKTLDLRGILKTYLLGWVFFPVIIFSPMFLAVKEVWNYFQFPADYHFPYIIFSIVWMLLLIGILFRRFDRNLYNFN